MKGLTVGATYHNTKDCGTFTKYIATATQNQVADELTKAKFVSVTSDRATDSSIIEQEIVFACYSSKGVPSTRFVGLKQPISPNANSFYPLKTSIVVQIIGDSSRRGTPIWQKLFFWENFQTCDIT